MSKDLLLTRNLRVLVLLFYQTTVLDGVKSPVQARDLQNITPPICLSQSQYQVGHVANNLIGIGTCLPC